MDETSANGRQDVRAVAATPVSQQPEPSGIILNAQDVFLAELDCISEMVFLVLPILQSRDEKRTREVKELIESITSPGNVRSARIVSAAKALVSHVRRLHTAERMFRENMVTSMVTRFDVFFADLLKAVYRENLSWLQGSERKLSYREILALESIDKLKAELIEREIDQLMRDSHFNQISFLDERLKLGIRSEFSRYPEFIEITERRNLFVHTGGIASDIYLENCRKWGIDRTPDHCAGKYLGADDEYLRSALDCFYELGIRAAQAIVRRLFKNALSAADDRLMHVGYGLLQEQRWELAERVTTFALSIPGNMSSLGEWRYLNTINCCIARKWAGKSIEDTLRSVDWSGLHPRYELAIAVLEDRFADAARLMRRASLRGELTAEEYRDWPLFRAFRETSEFEQAFADVFGTTFGATVAAETAQLLESATDSPSSMTAIEDPARGCPEQQS